jgi:hypothetical protein
MPQRRIQIEAELLREIEKIGKDQGVSLSCIVNEALSVALAQRQRRAIGPVLTVVPRTRLAERDEILSILDF